MRAFVTYPYLMTITFVALCLGVGLPLLEAGLEGRISMWTAAPLAAALPALGLWVWVRMWLENRAWARRMDEIRDDAERERGE